MRSRKGLGAAIGGIRSAMLQWSRDDEVAESGDEVVLSDGGKTLQWSRDDEVAERCFAACQDVQILRASMEPRR